MGDFLTFRWMVTPILIQVVYWISTIVVIVGGLVVLVAAPGGTERALGLAVLGVCPRNNVLTDIRH